MFTCDPNSHPRHLDILESGEHSKLNAAKSIASSSGSSLMEKSVTRDETLKAEILWALKAIMSHYSYKSCEGTSKLFQAMFPDSRIASQFTCGEKKCAYLICFGLAPHFKQLLKDVVKKEEAYVLMFDESLNSVWQSKQMDIHIHSWNQDKHKVESRYYTLVFMGHGTADDMLSQFRSGIEGIPLKKSLSGWMLLSLCLGNLNKHNKQKINIVISSLMMLPHRFRKYM